MRKVIHGKMYDTETASFCGSEKFGNYGDYKFLWETLYRKKTGEFFLHCEGGAGTYYGQDVATNARQQGELIDPLNYDEAKSWAEEHLTGDEYESIFGEVPEDDESSKVLTARVSAATLAKLQRHQSVSGETIGSIVEKAIDAYINQ